LPSNCCSLWTWGQRYN